MPFVVTAVGINGQVRREHDGAKDAVLNAIELLGQGLSDVVLTDPTGRTYRSGEFQLLLNESGKFDAPRT
jgi:hypothetical protein